MQGGTRTPKPRPPGRSGSGRGSADAPASVILVAPSSTLALPVDDAPRTLRHKLSSSSLTMSQPPDSPPTTFDSLPTSTLHSRGGSPRSTRTACEQGPAQLGLIPFPSKERSASITSNASLPAATALLSARARTLSARARLVDVGFAQPAHEAPPLNSQWLESKSREELEALLTEADRVIRERTRDLEAAASVGKFLLDENNTLRSRHDSIAARSPNKNKAASPASPASRPWRSSLGAASGSSSLARRTPRPSLYSADPADLEEAREGPSTPTRNRTLSSTTSIASIFAVSPRTTGHAVDTTSQLATLDQANYVLHLQLTELEAEAEKQERNGKKKLKKLEKEIFALKDELGRAEQRNGILESAVEASHQSSSESRGGRAPDASSCRRRDSSSDSGSSHHGTPTRAEPHQTTLDQDSDDGAPGIPTSSSRSTSDDESDHDAAVPFRRPPGKGIAFVDESFKISQAPSIPDQQQDALVAQLVAKIDELRVENEAITDQRLELVDRWDQAQRDLDQYRQRCDELEDFVEMEWGGHQQGTIAWDDTGEDSQTKLKGNQRSIRSRNDRSVSFSSHSTFRDPSPSPRERRRGPADQQRTLGSELGSGWDGESEGRRESDDNAADDDDGQSTSTSTPLRFRAPHKDYIVDKDASLNELIPPGSLRYSGPPDSQTYERISQAVADAPVVWEDGPTPPRPRARGLLSSLSWASKVEDDPWDASKYPEPDEGDDVGESSAVARIESRETVEEREGGEERQRWSEVRKRRYRRKQSPGADSKGSRRDRALVRLGLPVLYGNDTEDSPTPVSGESGSVVEHQSEDEESSEFEYLNSGEHRERGDYFPVSLRARYAPRVMVSWAADSAIRQFVSILLFIKLCVVLGLAVVFALWQGPKKTLGVVDNGRRRIR